MNMPAWIIIYGDGTTYSSLQGTWTSAPATNVQVIVYLDPDTGWTLRHGASGRSPCDFFRKAKDDTFVGMDTAGMVEYVINELGVADWGCDLVTIIRAALESGTVKQGRMLSSRQWQERYRQAILLRQRLIDGST